MWHMEITENLGEFQKIPVDFDFCYLVLFLSFCESMMNETNTDYYNPGISNS